MRRVALTFLCVAGAAAAAPAALSAPALAARQPKPADARARLVACHPALDQLSRSLTVDATMRSLQANDRMQLRFLLYQRAPSQRRFSRLAGPGLGTWNPATPGVDRFRFRKPIQNLPAPASFYVKVSYRWLDAANHAFAHATRVTGVCFQPDLRPDLRIVDIGGARRRAQGDWAYRVTLRNAGRTASGPFDAVLTIGGLPQPPQTLRGLAPGERRVVELFGPRCDTGTAERVELDPDNRVGEAVESNNSRSTTC